MSDWPHTAALLAGGASRRMGRRKDHLVTGDGRTMIECVAAAAREVTSRLVVVGPEDALPGTAVVEEPERIGPLGAVAALLASGIDTRYLVLPCDLPDVTGALLQELCATPNPVAAFTVDGESGPRPMPLLIDVAVHETCTALLAAGERSLRSLLAAVDVAPIALDAHRAKHELRNVNEPSDV